MGQYAIIMPNDREQMVMREIEAVANELRKDQVDYVMHLMDSWKMNGQTTSTFFGCFKRAVRKAKDNRP